VTASSKSVLFLRQIVQFLKELPDGPRKSMFELVRREALKRFREGGCVRYKKEDGTLVWRAMDVEDAIQLVLARRLHMTLDSDHFSIQPVDSWPEMKKEVLRILGGTHIYIVLYAEVARIRNERDGVQP
jgi:hypothetical protein